MKTMTYLLGIAVAGLLVASRPAMPFSVDAAKKPLTGYSVLVVDKFTVEKNGATEHFPKGQELLLQQGSVERLKEKKTFAEIIDASEPPAAEAPPPPVQGEAKRRLVLSGTVIAFDKGSRASRWLVGFGAGATKVKVRFIFSDAETGVEVFRTDRQGKFYGTFSVVGGDKSHAVSEAAGDVVDGLIKDIAKNR